MTGILGLLAGGNDHDSDADPTSTPTDVDATPTPTRRRDHDAITTPILTAWAITSSWISAWAACPMSIIWQTFAVSFAFAGIATNTIYAAGGAADLHSLAWTVPISLVFGYVVTRVLARALGRVVANPSRRPRRGSSSWGSRGWSFHRR
jgi:hypothetical protein